MTAPGHSLQREVFPAQDAAIHPHPRKTYFFYAKANQPPQPTAKPVVSHLQNHFQEYGRHSAPCSFWAVALETLTKEAEPPAQHLWPRDITATTACFPAHGLALWTASTCACVGPSGGKQRTGSILGISPLESSMLRCPLIDIPWIRGHNVDQHSTTARRRETKFHCYTTHFLWEI